MKRYEKYRDSGLEWIGDIPEHWELKQFKYLISILTDYTANGSFASLAENVKYLSSGYSRLIRLTDLRRNLDNDGVYVDEKAHNYLSKSELFGGELLLANVGAYTGLAWKMPEISYKATLAPNMFLLKFNKTVDPTFILFLFKSSLYYNYLQLKAVSSAQPKINKEDVKFLKALLPPLPEQKAISAFLDRETSRIDKLIEKKKRLIELLKEKRQAMITRAVTKGLDPDVKMKNAEMEWEDEVPEHWEVCRLRFLVEIKKRIAGSLEFDVLSITQKGIKKKDIESNEGQLSMDYSKYQIVEVGDFAMNHMDLLTGYIDIAKFKGVTSPDYRVFTIKNDEKLSPKYYLFLFQMCYQLKIFYAFGKGVSLYGRWRFPADEFKDFIVPVPPVSEQHEIAAFLESETSRIDAIVEKISIQLEKLKELRQVLISNAVTGKIDVRNEVKN